DVLARSKTGQLLSNQAQGVLLDRSRVWQQTKYQRATTCANLMQSGLEGLPGVLEGPRCTGCREPDCFNLLSFSF
ncbi:MAG TPA: hypothetical protein VJ464_01865, partial [Blastocatellia bacterium]|nr:hypothetical protein [Blastocatellia bacterium]